MEISNEGTKAEPGTGGSDTYTLLPRVTHPRTFLTPQSLFLVLPTKDMKALKSFYTLAVGLASLVPAAFAVSGDSQCSGVSLIRLIL
jgi:hypothetical protein